MKIKLFTFPNILTLCNLLCGAGATVAALRYGDLFWPLVLIVTAAVFDFLDGFAARLLKSYSPLGKELDSLADCISFGMAPAAVLLNVYYAAGARGCGGIPCSCWRPSLRSGWRNSISTRTRRRSSSACLRPLRPCWSPLRDTWSERDSMPLVRGSRWAWPPC
ncbi:MAG: CDP-alcohol phosphatidyltransferase family protein [Alistipes indistinctus]